MWVLTAVLGALLWCLALLVGLLGHLYAERECVEGEGHRLLDGLRPRVHESYSVSIVGDRCRAVSREGDRVMVPLSAWDWDEWSLGLATSSTVLMAASLVLRGGQQRDSASARAGYPHISWVYP